MAKKNVAEISVVEMTKGRATFSIYGTTPLILNRMSQKAKHELLLPKGRKTAAEKAANLKHSPLEEYRASPYRVRDSESPVLLAHKSSAFKGALANAALDMPGATKTQMGRLTYVEGELTGIYGVPQIFMAITRSADIRKTPDVRTRLIIPEWAANVTVTWVQPLVNQQIVANLFVAAGITQGVGDWRPEKGKGSYGQFTLVAGDDPDFLRIIKSGGRYGLRPSQNCGVLRR